MKTLSKVSLAVVIAAAMANGAMASSRGGGGERTAPAPAHFSAPSPRMQSPAPQPVRYSQPAPTQQPIRYSQPTPTQQPVRYSQPSPNPQPVRYTQPVPARTEPAPVNFAPARTMFTQTSDGQTNKGEHTNNNTKGTTDGAGRVGKSAANVKNIHAARLATNSDGYRNSFEKKDHGEPLFHFSFYLNAPTVACVPSPWYEYPGLPAYLPLDQVVIENNVSCNWDAGAIYNFDPYAYSANASLNNAVAEITSVFQGGDISDVQNLVAGGSDVNVYSNGQYQYSVSGTDFQQMMDDNAQNTQTVSFQVTTVRVSGANAIVDATHTFTNPDGQTQTVYQEYRLLNVNGQYFITDFSTSQAPL